MTLMQYLQTVSLPVSELWLLVLASFRYMIGILVEGYMTSSMEVGIEHGGGLPSMEVSHQDAEVSLSMQKNSSHHHQGADMMYH
jgi:hypothetical protein